MKQFFLLLVCLIITINAKAQFMLTPDGWITESGKTYYVVEIHGTQKELFNKAKVAFTQLYKSAKDVLSYSEPDIIKANGFSDTPRIKEMGIRTSKLNMTYSITVLFKDGKIRFDAPAIGSLYSLNKDGSEVSLNIGKGGGAGFTSFGSIFKKDGKVRYKEAKQSLEDYFNGIINSIVSSIEKPTIDEDW